MPASKLSLINRSASAASLRGQLRADNYASARQHPPSGRRPGAGGRLSKSEAEEQQMTDMFRDCPECGSQRRFTQHHSEPVGCPDSADGVCPDWFCADCGTGLLIALLPVTLALAPADAGLPTAVARRGAAGAATGRLDQVA